MKEALKLALEALEVAEHFVEEYAASKYYFAHVAVITAIKEALSAKHVAQPEQEPVAWMCHPFGDDEVEYGPHKECENCIPLYATPPPRAWVGLTDEEIDELHGSPMDLEHSGALKWVRIIEAKLKEKNT
jgi:hypothetical protein